MENIMSYMETSSSPLESLFFTEKTTSFNSCSVHSLSSRHMILYIFWPISLFCKDVFIFRFIDTHLDNLKFLLCMLFFFLVFLYLGHFFNIQDSFHTILESFTNNANVFFLL